MITAVLFLVTGCQEHHSPFSELPEIAAYPAIDWEDGLETVGRIDLGGSAKAIAVQGSSVLVCTPTGIDIDGVDGRIPTAGECRDLWADRDYVWVADGTEGVTRVRLADRSLARWLLPGRSLAITGSAGRIWVADAEGRVFSIDAEAEPGAGVLAVDVDGVPVDIAPFDAGAVVAARDVGLLQVRVDGETLRVDPLVAPAQRVGATEDGLLFTTGDRLRSWPPGVDLRLPRGARRLEGNLIALGDGGLVTWDGASGFDVRPIVDDSQHPLPVRDVAVLEDRIFLACGQGGVVELDGATQRHTPTAGVISALEVWQGQVLVATERMDKDGSLFLLQLDDKGAPILRDKVEIPSMITDIQPVEGGVLVAGSGIFWVPLEGKTLGTPVDIGGFQDVVFGLALAEQRVAALVRARGLLWMQPGSDTWEVTSESPLGEDLTALELVSHGERVAVTYSNYGRLKVFEPGLGSPLETTMAGAAMCNETGAFVPAGGTSALGRIWVGLPRLGLEGFDPETGDHQRIPLPTGAWDVEAHGDLLAVALDTDGVALLDPSLPEPVVAHLDLPGYVWNVVSVGQYLVVASEGTLFVVRPI